MPAIQGLLETALYVADVQAAAQFYRRLFKFEPLLESEKLVALDVVGRDVLLLFKRGATEEPTQLPGGVIPGHATTGRSHLAFAITSEELEAWRQRLADEGVAIESEVTWPGGARSVYFRDVDQHLVELLTPGFWRTY